MQDKTPLTRDDVIQIIGRRDDVLIARIIKTGANRRELMQAYGWVTSDDYMASELHHRPNVVVQQLIDLLTLDEQEPDAQ